MKTEQIKITHENELSDALSHISSEPDWILAFGHPKLLSQFSESRFLKERPGTSLCGCSTSGEIMGDEISDDSLILTFFEFEKTTTREHRILFESANDSEKVGKELAEALSGPDLQHVFVLSDGLNINGSQFVHGLRSHLPPDVAVTGGLAGDGDRFQHTGVLSRHGFESKQVVGVGFYGKDLLVGFGSLGGWDPFGPERTITRVDANILYELDGRPALPLYKEYLGDLSKELPASGLLFPLSIKTPGRAEPIVRTLLAIDEKNDSLTFAGDLPSGGTAQLMMANMERLLDGAASAAQTSLSGMISQGVQAAILISCVGRRLVLKQRTEEEIDAVRSHFGRDTCLTGFYSYGEIAPFRKDARCELHNQTMTITCFSER